MAQYMLHPVAFGGNAGVGNFVGVGTNGPYITASHLDTSSANAAECLLYQLATENEPSSVTGSQDRSGSALSLMRNVMAPVQAASGCPIDYNHA